MTISYKLLSVAAEIFTLRYQQQAAPLSHLSCYTML